MRTDWINPAVLSPSRSSPRSFDMSGGASSCPLSSGAPLLLVRSSSRPVLLASCVSLVRAFIRCLRRVCLLIRLGFVPSYRRIVRLPVRSTSGAGRWRFASRSWLASVVARCLRFVAFSLSPAVLPCVVPVACFALSSSSSGVVVVAHGLSSVVVSRRRPVLLAIVVWVRRGPIVVVRASSVAVARRRLACHRVSSFVSSSSRRPFAPPCLSCGGADCGACSLVPCDSLLDITSVAALRGWVSICGRACLLRCGSWSGGAALLSRLVHWRLVVARCPPLLAWRRAWRGRLVLASRSPPIRISPRPPCRGAGRLSACEASCRESI